MANKFVVRVYGVLMKDQSLLVSDELVKGRAITKFPGGGLEFGEGTLECLEREFYEELNVKIRVEEHVYTTDFYVASVFDPSYQVISIYYKVSTADKLDHHISTEAHAYKQSGKTQSFRWLPLKQMRESDFSLVIDKKVAELILEKYGTG